MSGFTSHLGLFCNNVKIWNCLFKRKLLKTNVEYLSSNFKDIFWRSSSCKYGRSPCYPFYIYYETSTTTYFYNTEYRKYAHFLGPSFLMQYVKIFEEFRDAWVVSWTWIKNTKIYFHCSMKDDWFYSIPILQGTKKCC